VFERQSKDLSLPNSEFYRFENFPAPSRPPIHPGLIRNCDSEYHIKETNVKTKARSAKP